MCSSIVLICTYAFHYFVINGTCSRYVRIPLILCQMVLAVIYFVSYRSSSLLPSDLREIPSTQEVFAHPTTDQSIIFDLLEYQSIPDESAVQYVALHLQMLIMMGDMLYHYGLYLQTPSIFGTLESLRGSRNVCPVV